MDLFREVISKDYVVMQAGTSEGTQIKYRKDGFWYKKDHHGKEGLAEYLSSRLLTFSSLEPSEFILYEQGTINDDPGCRSKNFLKQDEELITFYRLYFNQTGKDLSQIINRMDEMEERVEYVIEFFRQSCSLDVREYLSKVLTLDMLILNEDRHLNNLAVILKGDIFTPAPIFDNGVSLLTANQSVNWHFSIEENVKRVNARPFSGTHEKMVNYLGRGFDLDCDGALRWLESETESRERDVLRYQIEKYRVIFDSKIQDSRARLEYTYSIDEEGFDE